MEPASIRYNNPGAMWGGNAISRKWGATQAITLNDGLKQGNNIAFFPTRVQGAAAQFDLWRSRYCNMTLQAAITKWSGGNWSQPYANFLTQHTGLGMSTMVTSGLLAGPSGLKLLKFQAQWEAGAPYPMTDADWAHAQEMCFGTRAPVSPEKKKAGAIVAAGTGGVVVATQAARQGSHWSIILAILVLAALAGGAAWLYFHRKG